MKDTVEPNSLKISARLFILWYSLSMRLLPKFGVELHEAKLKNGANVFLFRRKGMPVNLRASFFAGARFDAIPGTAHFLEHMLAAGTKRFPAKNLIAEHIQKVGGEFGASTGSNFLNFNIEIPESADLDVGMEVVSECLTNSLFDEKTLENERGAIFSEIKSKKSNPGAYIWEVQKRLSLQGTDMGRSVLGTVEDVGKITKDDLLNHYKKFIHSGRLCFIASGDVTIETLTEKLGSINFETGEKFEMGERLPIIKDKLLDVEQYPGVEHLEISLACRTETQNYEEYCALMILSNILGRGRGSRLTTRLRYENGLVYGVATSVYDEIDWGRIDINLSCDRKNFEKAKELIFAEFEKLKKENITAEEFTSAKSRISKGIIRFYQTSVSWVDSHGYELMFFPSAPHIVDDYIQTTNRLSLSDVKKVIDKYLLKENFYTAICGDYK